jgi:hypothetical protein
MLAGDGYNAGGCRVKWRDFLLKGGGGLAGNPPGSAGAGRGDNLGLTLRVPPASPATITDYDRGTPPFRKYIFLRIPVKKAFSRPEKTRGFYA